VKTRHLIPLVAALVIVALCIANWSLLSETVSLNLLLGRVQAPVIVLVLSCIGIVALASLAGIAWSTHAWNVERRRLASDLDRARSMAEKEEESRTQALRATMEREFAEVRGKLDSLIARQGALPGRESRLEHEGRIADAPAAIEPELVPPRVPSPRRRH
jgi:hypothetical protein